MMKATKIEGANSGDRSRVLIVEDHPLMRRGMMQLIEREPDIEVAGEAANAGDALRFLSRHTVDLVIVDIGLDEGDGLDLIKQIKARGDDVKILVASVHDESLYAQRALQAGAQGYISKSHSSDAFIEAMRQVMAGKIYLSPYMTERMLHRVVDGGDNLSHSPIETLSDRELEVFRLIGEGLSTRVIAEKLFLSTKTIETYREHIKRKLNLKNSVEVIRHAVQWVIEEA